MVKEGLRVYLDFLCKPIHLVFLYILVKYLKNNNIQNVKFVYFGKIWNVYIAIAYMTFKAPSTITVNYSNYFAINVQNSSLKRHILLSQPVSPTFSLFICFIPLIV